jgi:hypothetical protein
LGHNIRLVEWWGALPATEQFLGALHVMDEATHGFDVTPSIAAQAVEVGTAFLIVLKKLNAGEKYVQVPTALIPLKPLQRAWFAPRRLCCGRQVWYAYAF